MAKNLWWQARKAIVIFQTAQAVGQMQGLYLFQGANLQARLRWGCDDWNKGREGGGVRTLSRALQQTGKSYGFVKG